MNTDFLNVQDSTTASTIQYVDTLKSEATKIIHGCTSWLHYSLRESGIHGEQKDLLRKKAPESLPGRACVGPWCQGAISCFLMLEKGIGMVDASAWLVRGPSGLAEPKWRSGR